MSQKVTIAQVAKAAGVSIATVSRVLNQREGKIKISEETASQVRTAADRLGYHADPFASALRTRRSGLIGAIIRDLRDPFLIKIFLEMQAAARESGFELLLANANFDISAAGRQASIMNGLWFDGLILLGDMPGDLSVIHQVQMTHKPCVAVACGTRQDIPSINLDEKAGVHLALDYLTSLGHRRIACLGDPHLLGVQERLVAFKEYAEQHGLILEPGYMEACDNDQRGAAQQAARLMGLAHPPTAFFCSTDVIALGVISQLGRSGLSVPEDVSVTGFDDIEEAANTFPSLTTVLQPADRLAQQALHMLFRLIEPSDQPADGAAPSPEGVPAVANTIVIQPELVIRESCAPVKEPGRVAKTQL